MADAHMDTGCANTLHLGARWEPVEGERVRAFGIVPALLGRVVAHVGNSPLVEVKWDRKLDDADVFPTTVPACERCGGYVRVRWVSHAGYGWYTAVPLEDLTEGERKAVTGPYPLWWCERCSPRKVHREPESGQVWQWSDAYGPLILIKRTTDHTGEGAWTAYSLTKKARETLWIYDSQNPCWYVRIATDKEMLEALSSPDQKLGGTT